MDWFELCWIYDFFIFFFLEKERWITSLTFFLYINEIILFFFLFDISKSGDYFQHRWLRIREIQISIQQDLTRLILIFTLSFYSPKTSVQTFMFFSSKYIPKICLNLLIYFSSLLFYSEKVPNSTLLYIGNFSYTKIWVPPPQEKRKEEIPQWNGLWLNGGMIKICNSTSC